MSIDQLLKKYDINISTHEKIVHVNIGTIACSAQYSKFESREQAIDYAVNDVVTRYEEKRKRQRDPFAKFVNKKHIVQKFVSSGIQTQHV